MRSRLREREREGEGRRTGRFPCPWRCRLLLRDREARLWCRLCGSVGRVSSCEMSMRWETERERVRRRPRSPGLKELMRRRVLRSTSSGERESRDADLRRRLVRALSSPPRCDVPLGLRRRGGDRERDGERLVEMVDTESADDVDSDLERLRSRPDRSSSFFFSISSATPFLRSRSSGTWVVSFGFSLGLRSCCVRDGRD
jgi:hypothetical protein